MLTEGNPRFSAGRAIPPDPAHPPPPPPPARTSPQSELAATSPAPTRVLRRESPLQPCEPPPSPKSLSTVEELLLDTPPPPPRHGRPAFDDVEYVPETPDPSIGTPDQDSPAPDPCSTHPRRPATYADAVRRGVNAAEGVCRREATCPERTRKSFMERGGDAQRHRHYSPSPMLRRAWVQRHPPPKSAKRSYPAPDWVTIQGRQ